MFFKRKAKGPTENSDKASSWFYALDAESQQETALSYLRRLDNTSLKRLYEAVELYRKADKILHEKVKEPEPEEEPQEEVN